MKFFLLSFLFLLVGNARAADAPGACSDTGKVYKICGDQQATFDGKLREAKGAGKMLVVVIGADWCPWCVSLDKMLKDPSFGKGFAKNFVFTNVGLYNGKAQVPSGERILDQIKTQAHYTKKIDGIPVLAVVNPSSGKATLIDTEPLEKNTATKKGHDPAKVLAALEKASTELR